MRWQESVPGALGWYRSISADAWSDYRRFGELAPDLGFRFAHYDLIATAAFLIGYLEQLGTDEGYCLLAINHKALSAEWDAIADKLDCLVQGPASMLDRSLPVNLRCWMSQRSMDSLPSILPDVATNLRCHASVAANIDAEIEQIINRDQMKFNHHRTFARTSLANMSGIIIQDPCMNAAALDRTMRIFGFPFRDGCHEMEQYMRYML